MVEKAGFIASIKFALRVFEALQNLILRLRPTSAQPALELLETRRRDEDVMAREVDLAALPTALHINIKDANFARLLHSLDGGDAGAVEVAVHLRMLQETVEQNVCRHLVRAHKVVMHAVHLALPWLSRRMTHAEPERVGELLLEHLDQRSLADTGRARDDERLRACHAVDRARLPRTPRPRFRLTRSRGPACQQVPTCTTEQRQHRPHRHLARAARVLVSQAAREDDTYYRHGSRAGTALMEEKPHRVLCLHGWRTNPSVMQFQAQDLSRRLSEACSMHFMAARVEQSEACDPMIGASFPAPYYEHWGLHTDDEEAMNEDICATVRYTADFVARNGPFHAIVGFSQGAGLASLLVALQQRLRLLPLPVLVCICGVRPAHRRQVPSSATCLVRRLLGPDPLLDADRSDAEAPDVAQIDCESIHIVGLQDPMVAKSRALSQVR